MELSQILQRCQEGDELAWEALVRLYQARVYGLARHYVGSREEARDVAQEVFIRVYQHLDRCADAEHFLPWLLRIGRNACIDHLRRRKARPPGQDVAADEMPDLADIGPSPEDDWHRTKDHSLVHLALQALGDLSREVILLKEIQGLKIHEIAKLLEVPAGTVKSRCNRARLELARKVLELSGGRFGREEAGS